MDNALPIRQTLSTGESEPFLWLAGFALCFGLHLMIHPQANVFRDALRWLGKHPSPLLCLVGSMMACQALAHWQAHDQTTLINPLTPWDIAFKLSFNDAFKRLVFIFHHAIEMPPLLIGHLPNAVFQSLTCAFSQIWFCCYLIGSQQVFTEEGVALKQAMERWINVLCLALCYLPWWWLQETSNASVARDWLVLEFLLFLAPVPLVIARTSCHFIECGALSILLWKRRFISFLLFTITALSLLVLLEYTFHMVDDFLASKWFFTALILKSITAATLHLWLFVSGALILLGGGYVPNVPTPDHNSL